MTIERLQLYKKKNGGKLPERIFVFRDGVSEVRICSFVTPNVLILSGSCSIGSVCPAVEH